MTLTLDLTPDETRRVENAKTLGFDVPTLLKSVISGLPAPTEPMYDHTEELFAQWAAEDATDDPAVIESAERELAAFKANMNANRAVTGERPVYK